MLIILIIAAAVFLFYKTLLPILSFINVHVVYPIRKRRLFKGEPDFKVNILVPCQEWTEFLEDNLRAIVKQDYGNFKVTFVTDKDDDPAVRAIKPIVQEFAHAEHFVAGYSDYNCSQQNFVQMTAIKADDQSEIFVKLDSDTRPEPGWLREFVRPYISPKVGLTSSHRLVSPKERGLAPYFYAIYEGFLTMLMGCPFMQWVWGGCFSIRRKTYDSIGIAEVWSKTGTDDTTLRHQAVSHNAKIVFVPDCVAVSHEAHTSTRGLANWISRQAFHGKLYVKPYWLMALVVEIMLVSSLILALVVLIAELLAPGFGIQGILASTILAAGLISGPLVTLIYPDKKDIPFIFWLLLSAPAHFVVLAGLLKSAFMKNLSWRNIVYEHNKDGTVKQIRRIDASNR